MYAQLGNIIFQGLLGFNSFSLDGDEATYAEFALINGKPRLQKTGDSLQNINIEIRLHAEFCNPSDQIELLKIAKNDGEILPLLMGNGKYISDYVIVSMPHRVEEAFSDGTAKLITVSLQIREYIAYNKIEQQQQQARKKAFAVGDKKPVVSRPPQPITIENDIAANITTSKQQSKIIDNAVNDFENNPSNAKIAARRIKNACKKAVSVISEMNQKLDKAKEIQNKVTGLKSIAESAKDAFNGVNNLYPFDSITDLKSSSTYLQSVMRTFNRTATPLFEYIITRN